MTCFGLMDEGDHNPRRNIVWWGVLDFGAKLGIVYDMELGKSSVEDLSRI